jgi:hypothetical protein
MADTQAPDLSVIAPVESPPELFTVTTASEPGIAVDIEALATRMRESEELEIKDRHHRMNIYPACFIGAEAVDWLMKAKNCTREEAIDLGQLMIERGIIHHVEDQHPFRDDRLFYRFYTDER